MIRHSMTVRSVAQSDLSALFAYLDDHLRDNGANETPLFKPMPRAESRLPQPQRTNFEHGLARRLDQGCWRRAWIAVSDDSAIPDMSICAHERRPARHTAPCLAWACIATIASKDSV